MENTSFREYFIKLACINVLNQVYGMNISITDAKATFANRELPDRCVRYFYFEKDSQFCEIIPHQKVEITDEKRRELMGPIIAVMKLLKRELIRQQLKEMRKG